MTRQKGVVPEDNYRIEVWDRQGGQLIETVCRSSSNHIIAAAWKEALNHYPGRFLIQYNDRHPTARATLPEANPPPISGRLDMRVQPAKSLSSRISA